MDAVSGGILIGKPPITDHKEESIQKYPEITCWQPTKSHVGSQHRQHRPYERSWICACVCACVCVCVYVCACVPVPVHVSVPVSVCLCMCLRSWFCPQTADTLHPHPEYSRSVPRCIPRSVPGTFTGALPGEYSVEYSVNTPALSYSCSSLGWKRASCVQPPQARPRCSRHELI